MWEVGMGQSVSGEVGYYLGNRIDESSQYGKGNPGILALPTYYYSFDSLDTRRDVTVCIYGIDADNAHTLEDLSVVPIGKWRREWMDPLFPGTAKYTGINWILLRYSDILLMFAEADNELNQGPSAAAIDALRQVRARAYAGNTGKMPAIATDYQGFFNDIVNERGWEFGGECLRKYDLIRWNLLIPKIQETKDNLAKLAAGESPYENVPQQVAWTNDGTKLVTMNLTTPLDSATIADRDMDQWPNVAAWGNDISQDYIDQVAQYLAPNRELLPIHQTAIDQDSNLQNDYGY